MDKHSSNLSHVYSARTRILLASGSEDLLTLLQWVLTSDTLELHTTTNGQTLLSTCAAQPPDILVLDLQLADMNGWEAYLRLQESTSAGRTHIIILANQASRVDRSFGMHVAGVHDYLLKPFLPSRLRHSVQRALSNHQLRFTHTLLSTTA